MKLETNVIELNLTQEYTILLKELNEKARRQWAGFHALRLGHGGKAIVHRATGLDYKTINRGISELDEDNH